jgi:tripartite-type tricarboxylate transporter receptor subunit TctC
MIVGSPPGSGSDLTVRLLAQRLSDRLPKGVIIENRPGAVGAIALEIAANATPDGYTLMSLSTQNLTAMLLKTVRTDIPNVFAPVAQTTSQPYLLVYSALPVATVTQLIAYAKAKPLVYASSGTGSAVHLGMELFKSMAGIEITHVPYKGSGLSMIDLMSGRVQLAITNTVTASPLVKNARIRALAVTSATRSATFPDVPTIAESGVPGYELGSWYGILAPIKTGGALIDILNKHINAVIAQPEFKEKLAEEGAEAAPPNTPAEFKALIANEVRRWDRFLKSSRLKLD